VGVIRRVALLEKIREWLLTVRDYQGISGTITVDSDGITRSLKVFPGEFKGGAFIPSAGDQPSR
jgi:hypothetical protein